MRIKVPTFILLNILLLGTSLRAQWIPVQGMDGGNCSRIQRIDSVFFTWTDLIGIFSRPSGSLSWAMKPSPLLWDFVTAGQYIVGYDMEHFYRSGDMGYTWDTLSMGSAHPWRLCSMDSTLFINEGEGIFRSDDFGSSWYKISGSLPGTNFWMMCIHDTIMYCTENDFDRIYVSKDKGLTWDSIPREGIDIDISYVTDICEFGTDTWLANLFSGIYRYSPMYHHWELFTDTLTFSTFSVQMGRLYGIGLGTSIYQLSINGDHWIPSAQGLGQSTVKEITSVDEELVCATTFGIYRSVPGGIWYNWSDGIHGGWIRDISCHEDSVWVCSDPGLYKSIDHGAHFQKQEEVTQPVSRILLTASGYFLQGIVSVAASYDRGNTWGDCMAGLPPNSTISDLAAGTDYLFLLANGKLYRSAFNPVYWNKIQDFDYPPVYRIEAMDSSVLVAVWMGNGSSYPVLISHNSGVNFEPVTCFEYGYYPMIHAEDGRFFIMEAGPLWISEDTGQTWNNRSTIQPNFGPQDLTAAGDQISVCGFNFGINILTPLAFISFDNGWTWENISDNLSGYAYSSCTSIQNSGTRLFLGSQSNGLWYRDDLLTGGKTQPSRTDQSLKIYPNPAKDEISIWIEGICEPVKGNLIMTDMSGRIVISETNFTLTDRRDSGRLDISQFSPGIYFLSFRPSGGNRHFGKLIKD